MTPEFEWEDWPPQVPSTTFLEAVVQGAPLREVACREWVPQRPDRTFALTATAQIVRVACQETQQQRVGMRVVRSILGDTVYDDLLAERDENRALLVHMFLRWAEHDARRVLGAATLVSSDEQAAHKLALDAVESATGTLGPLAESLWPTVDVVNTLEGRIRRRRVATPSDVRCFARWTMQRAYEVASHFVSEKFNRSVVREAFLFFLDRATASREAAPTGRT